MKRLLFSIISYIVVVLLAAAVLMWFTSGEDGLQLGYTESLDLANAFAILYFLLNMRDRTEDAIRSL